MRDVNLIEVIPAEALDTLPGLTEVVPSADFKAGTVKQEAAMKLAELLSRAKPVVEPTGGGFLKVKWAEFVKMREDERFFSRGQYEHFIHYHPPPPFGSGKPRREPLRPMAQNEVGMYPLNKDGQVDDNTKIVFLADAGPSDYGEGKYYAVGIDLAHPRLSNGSSDMAAFEVKNE